MCVAILSYRETRLKNLIPAAILVHYWYSSQTLAKSAIKVASTNNSPLRPIQRWNVHFVLWVLHVVFTDLHVRRQALTFLCHFSRPIWLLHVMVTTDIFLIFLYERTGHRKHEHYHTNYASYMRSCCQLHWLLSRIPQVWNWWTCKITTIIGCTNVKATTLHAFIGYMLTEHTTLSGRTCYVCEIGCSCCCVS